MDSPSQPLREAACPHLSLHFQPLDLMSKPSVWHFVGQPWKANTLLSLARLLQLPQARLLGRRLGHLLWLNVLLTAQASNEAPCPGLTWL